MLRNEITAGRASRFSRHFSLALWLCLLGICWSKDFVTAQVATDTRIQNGEALLRALIQQQTTQPEAIQTLLAEHRPLVTLRLWERLIAQAEAAYYSPIPQRALALYDLALEVARSLDDKKLLASTYYKIGLTRSGLNQSASAINAYQESRKLFAEVGLSRDLIYILSDLGSLYFHLQNFSEAKRYSEQSLALATSMNERPAPPGAWPDQYGVAGALSTLGFLSQQEGNLHQAITLWRRSLTLYQELNGSGSRYGLYIVDKLSALGSAYNLLGDNRQALTHLQQALAAARRLPYPNTTASVLNNLGAFYLDQEDYEQAADCFGQALEIYQKQRNQLETARVLLNFGVTQQRQGTFASSLASFAESLRLAQVAGNKGLMIAAEEGIGATQQAQGRLAEAHESLDRGLALAREIDDQLRIAEILWRKAETHYAAREYVAAAKLAESAAALAGQLNLPKLSYLTTTTLGRAYAGQQQRALAIQTLRQAIDQVEGMRQQVAGRERERQLFFENKVLAYHALLGLLIEEGKTREALRVAERAKGRVLLDLLDASQVKAASPTPEVNYDSLLRNEQTVLLEYVVTQERVYVFALTKDHAKGLNLTARRIDVSQATLMQRVADYHRMMADRIPTFATLSRTLYDLLLKPVEAQLRGKRTLCIVPDGTLWNVPFQTLEPQDNRYLIEVHSLHYAPSLTVAAQMEERARKQPTSASPSLLALANPSVNALTDTLAQPNSPALKALPEAEREAAALGKIFGPARSNVLLRAQANEQAFKSLASGYDILHLAAHGVLDDLHPLKSHLLLASSGRAGGKEDGRVEAREVMEMKLRADLVVLAACDTARGKVGAGEGVVGMSWAFFLAGCNGLVVSQWKVSSQVSAEWMIHFYRHLRPSYRTNRRVRAEALRQASLTLLADARYRHPFYWAGFVLVGRN